MTTLSEQLLSHIQEIERILKSQIDSEKKSPEQTSLPNFSDTTKWRTLEVGETFKEGDMFFYQGHPQAIAEFHLSTSWSDIYVPCYRPLPQPAPQETIAEQLRKVAVKTETEQEARDVLQVFVDNGLRIPEDIPANSWAKEWYYVVHFFDTRSNRMNGAFGKTKGSYVSKLEHLTYTDFMARFSPKVWVPKVGEKYISIVCDNHNPCYLEEYHWDGNNDDLLWLLSGYVFKHTDNDAAQLHCDQLNAKIEALKQSVSQSN